MFRCKILHRSTVPTVFIILMFFVKLGADPVCAQDAAQDGGVKTKTIEIPFTSYDGYEMFGKLTIPTSGQSHPVVIYVQTAEGMTVDTKRQKSRDTTFNYFDLYREKLPEMNVAFFSYEGRGIRMGDKPPRYETINWDIYNTSTLENKVRDIARYYERRSDR